MVNFALGTLLALAALALLTGEWLRLREWRRRPDETIYSERVFLRRALVSLLMMGFIVVYRLQPLALAHADRRRAALYLSLYFVLILAIFLLAAIDFQHHRRMAAALERQIERLHAESLRLWAQAQLRAEEKATGGSPGDAREPGPAGRQEERPKQ